MLTQGSASIYFLNGIITWAHYCLSWYNEGIADDEEKRTDLDHERRSNPHDEAFKHHVFIVSLWFLGLFQASLNAFQPRMGQNRFSELTASWIPASGGLCFWIMVMQHYSIRARSLIDNGKVFTQNYIVIMTSFFLKIDYPGKSLFRH